MAEFVITCTEVIAHTGLKFRRSDVVTEDRFNPEHVSGLVESGAIKNLDDMKYYKVVHFEAPGLNAKNGDVIREDWFLTPTEAESYVNRGYMVELTAEEVAAIPKSQKIVSPVIVNPGTELKDDTAVVEEKPKAKGKKVKEELDGE